MENKRRIPGSIQRTGDQLVTYSRHSAADIERELGITPGLLSRWNRLKAKAEGEIIAPRANRPLAEEPIAERVKQLERENERLRQKRNFKKAVAINLAALSTGFTHPNP